MRRPTDSAPDRADPAALDGGADSADRPQVLRDLLRQQGRGFQRRRYAVRVSPCDLLYKGQAPRLRRFAGPSRGGTREPSRSASLTRSHANSRARDHANEGAHTHGNERACCQTNRRARHRPSEHGSMRTRPQGARRAAPPTGAALCCPRDARRAGEGWGPFRSDGAPGPPWLSFAVRLPGEGIHRARIAHRLRLDHGHARRLHTVPQRLLMVRGAALPPE